jgi:hypothetical protein
MSDIKQEAAPRAVRAVAVGRPVALARANAISRQYDFPRDQAKCRAANKGTENGLWDPRSEQERLPVVVCA